MDYTNATLDIGYIEMYQEEVQEEIVTYAQSWSDEYQTLAQEIVDRYLASVNKTEDMLTEDDVTVLDEMVFTKIN